jgi:hypothetical protein
LSLSEEATDLPIPLPPSLLPPVLPSSEGQRQDVGEASSGTAAEDVGGEGREEEEVEEAAVTEDADAAETGADRPTDSEATRTWQLPPKRKLF